MNHTIANNSPEEAPQQSQATESLLHRMAGPSSGKAGLAKDQTEINRIIVEASKGSKFYENEKKKDKELTLRIDRILKLREDVVRGADLTKIETAVDQILMQLEEQRDLTQSIVHVDMDAFYASVELLDNPSLKGKPFGVGKGVLTTASYEARKYGVRSGMAGFVAKKLCPDLIFISNHFSRYSDMSSKVFEVFHRYDPDMCPAGCDEGYLNVTPYCQEHSLTAEECVRQMREEVFRETRLTVSAGIAPNKMLAKICSDKNKPNGQFELKFDAELIKKFMHELPIRKIPGIGRVNERLLDAIGIKTCGDIYSQRAALSLMDKQFGLVFLLRTYLGIASNVVRPHAREERKSIGSERTFSALDSKDKILDKLTEISVELEKDMEESGWVGRTITLKYKLDTYQVFTRARAVDHWVSKKEELFAIGKELLLPEFPMKIRLIGLRVTKLKDLKAAEPTNGIKRFFESAKDSNESRKKAKPETNLDMHEMEESMPGYHEHDESDFQMDEREDEPDLGDEVVEIDMAANSSRPPHSKTSLSGSPQPGPSRPRSRGETAPPSRSPPVVSPSKKALETQTCPICSKTLETDNDGLNTHVDFCLSRGAIMEAQVEASQSSGSKKLSSHRKGFSNPSSVKNSLHKPNSRTIFKS
ncbi:DNA/RNA polymerase [Crepidotus variabilis]|uniref:DNA polymerase kappa n=1 Tax=Crepidotus variabilis TaxID=179855 RepID=A0A9P6EI21_9AGAR|nr:DNA/RNA polymerase [Crepidotus variabilis]